MEEQSMIPKALEDLAPKAVAAGLLEVFPDTVNALEIFHTWAREFRPEIPKEEVGEIFLTFLEERNRADERKEQNKKPESISADDLIAKDLPSVEWIIDKVIPKGGLVAISGVPGSFKSYFTLWMAIRIGAGLPLFGSLDQPFFCEQKTVQTGVLFIEEENSAILTRQRLRGFQKAPGSKLYLRIEQGFKIQDQAWRSALLEEIGAKGIGLVILDPFSSIMGLEDENDNAKVAVVMDLIRREFLSKSITIVFLHHPAKSASGAASLRGAGDILGKCDVHLLMERDEIDKRVAKVRFEKMRLISEEEVQNFKIRLSGDQLLRDEQFRYLGEAETKEEEMERNILNTMMPGEEFTREEVAESLAVTSGGRPFRLAWKKLLAEKKIYKSATSRKFLAKGGDIL